MWTFSTKKNKGLIKKWIITKYLFVSRQSQFSTTLMNRTTWKFIWKDHAVSSVLMDKFSLLHTTIHRVSLWITQSWKHLHTHTRFHHSLKQVKIPLTQKKKKREKKKIFKAVDCTVQVQVYVQILMRFCGNIKYTWFQIASIVHDSVSVNVVVVVVAIQSGNVTLLKFIYIIFFVYLYKRDKQQIESVQEMKQATMMSFV